MRSSKSTCVRDRLQRGLSRRRFVELGVGALSLALAETTGCARSADEGEEMGDALDALGESVSASGATSEQTGASVSAEQSKSPSESETAPSSTPSSTHPATYAIDDKVLADGRHMPVLGIGMWTLTSEQAEASSYSAL